jgi:hypothetical protein
VHRSQVTKHIHKFEQQKRGNRSPPRANGYNQMSTYPSRHSEDIPPSQGYPGSPAHQLHGHQSPPPPGRLASEGWTQEYDVRSQRWYYVERSTGRAQWHPPNYASPRVATFQSDVRMPNSHDEWTRRERVTNEPQRPGSSAGGGWNGGRGGGSTDGTRIGRTYNPGQGLHTQLPPGAHLDLKTGKMVSSMFPEGQTHQSWAKEVRRI